MFQEGDSPLVVLRIVESEVLGHQLLAAEIAEEQEAFFHSDIADLHLKPAHRYPRATDHIPEMIEMIEALVEKEYAYESEGRRIVGCLFLLLSLHAAAASLADQPALDAAGDGSLQMAWRTPQNVS